MKFKSIFIIWLSVLILAIGTAFQLEPETPFERVSTTYADGISDFTLAVSEFKEAVSQRAEAESLKERYAQMRLSYKRIEFLVAYADLEWVNNFINGAPLPHLEPKTSGMVVLEPEGLQRIEELVFEDQLDWPVLQNKTNTLWDNAEKLEEFSKYHNFSDREIMEALRLEVVRILTQGITGFDTPGSDQAIVESAVALGAARDIALLYDVRLMERDQAFTRNYIQLWNNAVQYLEDNPAFDSFDRGTFTRDYLEPLFGAVKQAQEILYIEFKDETTTMVQSVNHRAEHIFSDEWINPYFFTMMEKEEYTDAKVELGQLLFFDPVLSTNLERSCASCHKPEMAFTDGLAKSTALHFEGTVDRNAPTLVNAVLSPRFFYDLRAQKLEAQFDHVIFNPLEFNTSYAEIENRLKESSEYVALFEDAFGSRQGISKHTIQTALGAYITSLTSFNSEVDVWLRGEGEVAEEVERGYNLFMGKAVCATCHFPPTFSGLLPPLYQHMESEVLGVPADTAYSALDSDLGRAGGLMKEASEIYNHSFKTVTVRNVELTSPYMHNGVFTSLEEVVQFYNEGGGSGRGLDVPNQTLPFDELSLSAQEISDIVAFMNALTDLPQTANAPQKLPSFEDHPEWNHRTIGGDY